MLKIINEIFSGKNELVKGDKEMVEEISKEFMSEGMFCPVKEEDDKYWRNIFARF